MGSGAGALEGCSVADARASQCATWISDGIAWSPGALISRRRAIARWLFRNAAMILSIDYSLE